MSDQKDKNSFVELGPGLENPKTVLATEPISHLNPSIFRPESWATGISCQVNMPKHVASFEKKQHPRERGITCTPYGG